MKVNETRKRSWVKTITQKAVEYGIDAIVMSGLYQLLKPISQTDVLILAVVAEISCIGSHYYTERIWNKIHWGREVK